MRAHADRVWMAGGAIAAAVLIAVGWLLLINPTNAYAEELRQQADATQTQLIAVQNKVQAMQADQANLPTYQAELARNQQALPPDSGVPAFLRQLEDAGRQVGAGVSNFNVGQPTPVEGAGAPVFALPITVTVEGKPGQLSSFLDQLQQVQPRAVLIETANMTSAASADGGRSDGMSLTLTLKVFVAPPVSATPPTPPTTK